MDTVNNFGKVTASEPNNSCQWCKNFHKELAMLEVIEKALIGNTHNPKLHSIIANPHRMKTKEDLRTLLTEDLSITGPKEKYSAN